VDPNGDQPKFEAALKKLDAGTYNFKWDGKPIPKESPGHGKPSCDTDGGNKDGTKPTVHVTQQASFDNALALQQFITDSGLQ
jgi:hypothetical protein